MIESHTNKPAGEVRGPAARALSQAIEVFR
jgi:hypothetical protein